MKWMLEPDAFPNEPYYLLNALEEMGVPYETCKLGVGYVEQVCKIGRHHEDVVFHGSKQFAEVVRDESHWRLFWDEPSYECHYYYPRFQGDLAIENYVMMPFGDLDSTSKVERRRDWFYDHLGRDGKVFLKSDGFKDFSGVLVPYDDWDKQIRNIGCYADPETLVVVASPVEIEREWRLVVCDGAVVTGSLYKPNRGPVDEAVVEYANGVLSRLKKFTYDRIWVMDVALMSNYRFKVLEIGPFSCCALYESDARLVVEAVKKVMETKIVS